MGTRRVLHVLAQRPGLTGSGVTLDALVRHADDAGWDQAAVVGVPAKEAAPRVAELSPPYIHPLRFGTEKLPFPVPGMSDVMPYESTRYSQMRENQLDAYRKAWRKHLTQVIEAFEPHVIHSHHLWLVTGLVTEIAGDVPVVAHCHATALRQMELAPHLAEEAITGCRRASRFVVLHSDHAGLLKGRLGVEAERIHVVGAGYREELFHRRGRVPDASGRLLFVGKLAAAKGLPWLLDAFELLLRKEPSIELHVAGSGSGNEAAALRRRMEAMAPSVVMHGQLDQSSLGDLMRSCSVFVMPSFYEGLPLVLVEARACGCRLVSTALPGVTTSLKPHLGESLDTIPLPRMRSIDEPDPDDLPRWTGTLADAMDRAISEGGLCDSEDHDGDLAPFTWGAVFDRVEAIWEEVRRKS